MKILINALLLNDKFSGIGHFTQNLLSTMSKAESGQNKVEVLLSKEYSGALAESGNFKPQKLHFSTASRLKRIYFEQIELNKYLKQNKFDLYHTTNCISSYFSVLPTIITVHDLVALDYPEFCKNSTAAYYRLFLPNSIRKAKKIIAVSNTIKEDIIRKFDIDPEKIEVIHHGVGEEFTKIQSSGQLKQVIEKYQLPHKFLLFVGNLEPRKNLPNLIDALIELKKHNRFEHKLVIAGENGWKNNSIFEKVKQYGIVDDIIFTGYVDQQDLPSLYSLADLFVFPSFYEGFGLPVLEAMACGTPVLGSNRGALPEIIGTHLPSVNPSDVNDIVQKILLFVNDPQLKNTAVNYGKERVKQFTWEKTTQQTLNVYNQLLND